MPPRANNKKYSNANRGFNFCCVSYLDELQIQFVLCEHANHIKACAYIYHDKDLKEDGSPDEPHYHILLCLYTQRYKSSVKNWFKRFENADGDLINTLAQVCDDVPDYYRYLTHSDKKSKDKGKYRYNKGDIKGVNLDYFGKYDEQDKDTALNALEDLLNGCSCRQVFERYGRDAIYHISALMQCYHLVRDEEKGFLNAIDKHFEDRNL